MSTLLRRSPAKSPPEAPGSDDPAPNTMPTAGPKPRRRPARVALAVLLIVLAGLGGLYLWTAASSSTSVVQVSADVARGQLIQPGDLTTVTIGSTPGVATIPADQIDTLTGQRARWDLTAGTLLSPDQVTEDLQPGQGRTRISLQVSPGRMVNDTLPPGTRVRLVVTAPDGSPEFNSGTRNGTAYTAVLVSTNPAPDGANLLVTIDAAAGQATTVAQLAAQGRLFVVVDSLQR